MDQKYFSNIFVCYDNRDMICYDRTANTFFIVMEKKPDFIYYLFFIIYIYYLLFIFIIYNNI